MLERLYREVGRMNSAPERKFALSLCPGSASWSPTHPTTLEEVISLADQAMFKVKRARRE